MGIKEKELTICDFSLVQTGFTVCGRKMAVNGYGSFMVPFSRNYWQDSSLNIDKPGIVKSFENGAVVRWLRTIFQKHLISLKIFVRSLVRKAKSKWSDTSRAPKNINFCHVMINGTPCRFGRPYDSNFRIIGWASKFSVHKI